MNELKPNATIFKPYTLEFPAWLWGTGFAKGIYHDRQSLGVVLPAGASISVRRSSPIDSVVELDLLNDAGITETYVRVTEQWTTLIMTHASVPFIRTPYVPVAVEIEYSTHGEIQLPTYIPKGNASLFFQQWDQNGSAFALIQTTYANLLVPAADKDRLKQLHQEEGLDSLEAYYVRVFEYFNALAGISFGTLVRTDRNINNRYFIKADKSGGGSAYYGHGWTAQTADSIAACWLDTRADNWCALHEIAHGYQTLAMYNSTVPTGEVWNNIYATYYQHKMMGQSVYEHGWMYGGNAQLTFDAMQNRIESDLPPSKWYLHESLFLFMIIIDRVGESAFTEFNQYYRNLASIGDFDYLKHPLMDMWVGRWGDRYNVDIAPLTQLVGVKVSDEVALKNAYSNFQPCCPLYRVVPAGQLASIQQRLNLKTPFSLVDCQSLKVTDLKGDLTLSMTDRDYNTNKNKTMVLRNGSTASRLLKVSAPQLLLKNLPIGVYTLQHPSSPAGNRMAACHYVEVRAQMNNVIQLEYIDAPGTSLASQSIDFGGLYGTFATLSVDMKLHKATFSVVSESPHSYFGGSIYAGILVRDINGFVLFELELPGVGALLSVNEFSIGPGCSVAIHHQEPTRLSETPKLQSFIIPNSVDNVLEITPQGFRNVSLVSRPGDNLKSRIKLAADEFRKTPHVLLHAGSPQIQDVVTAVNTFDYPERELLLESCRDLVIAYSDTGGPIVAGGYFTWSLLGLGNLGVANIKINTVAREVAIEVYSSLPHSYVVAIYIAIWVRSADGEVLFSQELRGNVVAEGSYTTLPFAHGSTISVLHLEPVRAELINTDTQAKYPVKQIHVVRSLGDGKLQV